MAITAAAAVALGAALAVPHANGQSTAAPSTATQHSAASRPSTSATSTPASASSTDRTNTSADEAHRILRNWGAANPAGAGRHAVGTEPAAGVAGHIQEILRIPALGNAWAQPIYEGTGSAQLHSGVGHFEGTEEPGQIGNFAVAGHRSGVSAPPFRDVDRITVGSHINVTTAHRVTYIYTVTKVVTVPPSAVGYLGQVPGHPDATPTQPEMTIVTCWPALGHSKRTIIVAALTAKGGGL
ncbi:sortase [Streptomyces noursei]|uniref:sortase n=1 Tax=Streptomyces noursei TaxID=1971 RepID=UPI0013520C8F|nr:sortase [Streptomyces noursei]